MHLGRLTWTASEAIYDPLLENIAGRAQPFDCADPLPRVQLGSVERGIDRPDCHLLYRRTAAPVALVERLANYPTSCLNPGDTLIVSLSHRGPP